MVVGGGGADFICAVTHVKMLKINGTFLDYSELSPSLNVSSWVCSNALINSRIELNQTQNFEVRASDDLKDVKVLYEIQTKTTVGIQIPNN